MAAVMASAPAGAAELDHKQFAKLLQQHTADVDDLAGTRVAYLALTNSAEWKQLVQSLNAIQPEALTNRNQQLAFWINAYNILAIDVVVQNYPVASIRDVGSLLRPVWKRPAGKIGGRSVTLHEIEHEILRPLGDPRIHAAIVCASSSCPSLRREPFVANRIDEQLDDALRRFVAHPEKGARIEDGRLRVSKIFDWFEEDFASQGGVLAALLPHFPDSIRDWLEANSAPPKVAYFDYDWSLNELTGAP